MKPQNLAPDAASLWKFSMVPCARAMTPAAGAGVVIVRVGKAVRIKFEPAGHDLMNGAAKEKMALGPRGVSKGDGEAAIPKAIRTKD